MEMHSLREIDFRESSFKGTPLCAVSDNIEFPFKLPEFHQDRWQIVQIFLRIQPSDKDQDAGRSSWVEELLDALRGIFRSG